MTVVYACMFPVAGSQMLCSQPRRCCFLFGKQTCFSSVALTSKQEILGQQTSLTHLITIKTRTVFCKSIFFHQYQKYMRAWISVFGTFFVLYCAYLFICLLFVLLLPCSCKFYWFSGFWLTWCLCVSFVAFFDVGRILSEADGIFYVHLWNVARAASVATDVSAEMCSPEWACRCRVAGVMWRLR